MHNRFKRNTPAYPFNLPNQFNKNALHFLLEFLRSPRRVGSVCQSSAQLTKKLVEAISSPNDGLVVDLGAGTGVVTEQLLRHGYPMSNIVAVEDSPVLSQILRDKWPKLHVMAEDAAKALETLRKANTPVRTVISSLPLRVFSKEAVKTIMERIHCLLPDDGCLIQYSYALWMRFPLQIYGFYPVSSSFVFGNIPPARVDLYSNRESHFLH